MPHVPEPFRRAEISLKIIVYQAEWRFLLRSDFITAFTEPFHDSLNFFIVWLVASHDQESLKLSFVIQDTLKQLVLEFGCEIFQF